jgi:hypothetical protein
MRIDRTHRPWFAWTALSFAAATLVYIAYALTSQAGPDGGSALGLTFGIAGYAMMLFAGLLGARKKVPVWRVGRTQTWMRGHLWLGLLSFPMILYHGGFAWKGQLTAVLMILLFIVILSGIIGAAIQHYVPSQLTASVPLETIYEEIPHVRQQLRDEADQLVSSICGPLTGRAATPLAEENEPASRSESLVATVLTEVEPEDRARFRMIYINSIRPFLENPEKPDGDFATSTKSTAVFDSLRRMLPKPVHAVLEDLESICEEERQLSRQRKIYHLLHGWLLVHVPVSIALLVLGGIHAIVALRY